MKIRLIRHATLIVEIAGSTLLVDPVLNPAGARPPVANTANERRNPLVPLPLDAADILRLVDAVLVTHTHSDHWDEAATETVPKQLPIFCQPDDETKFREWKFTGVHPISTSLAWNGIHITRTGGSHGTGEIARLMAPVSGFVLKAQGEPTLYIAGDTIWCDEVRTALDVHTPGVIVVNAGEARFCEGDPITMSAADVIATAKHHGTGAIVIAVHMEAINHCGLSRQALRTQLRAAGLEQTTPTDAKKVSVQSPARVLIPQDGETLALGAAVSE